MSPRRNHPNERGRPAHRGSGGGDHTPDYHPTHAAKKRRKGKIFPSLNGRSDRGSAEDPCYCCTSGPMFFTPAAPGSPKAEPGNCVNCTHPPKPHGITRDRQS